MNPKAVVSSRIDFSQRGMNRKAVVSFRIVSQRNRRRGGGSPKSDGSPGEVPQPGGMVQRAAGQEVAGVVVGHVPHRLGVVAEGVRAATLLEAPQLDGAVAGRRGQKIAAAGKSKGFSDFSLRDCLQNSRLGLAVVRSPEEDATRLPRDQTCKDSVKWFQRLGIQNSRVI